MSAAALADVMDAPNIDLILKIFMPYAFESHRRALETGGRFVYYSSAETAYQILKNQEIWMRNTAVMNDYLEVKHGLGCLVQAYESDQGKKLQDAMNHCFPDISIELEQQFKQWRPHIERDTYVLSVSEHLPEEDHLGRLSMWRAYGGNSGVALVFNGGPMLRPSDAIGAYSSPVAYFDVEDVAEQLGKIAEGILQHVSEIQSQGKDWLKWRMFESFRFAAICTKHPAFKEEREWRVVSTQVLFQSDRLKPVCEVIGGVPQMLLKLKLQDIPDKGLHGLSMPVFLDRVLVGPCEHPEIVAAAMTTLLKELDIPNAEEKVHVTGVPLRLGHR